MRPLVGLCPIGQVLLPLNPLIADQESPVTYLASGHEQGPALHFRIQFNAVKAFCWGDTEVSWSTPHSQFSDLFTLGVKLWEPFPVAALENQCGIGPGMIMHIVRIAFEKLV